MQVSCGSQAQCIKRKRSMNEYICGDRHQDTVENDIIVSLVCFGCVLIIKYDAREIVRC